MADDLPQIAELELSPVIARPTLLPHPIPSTLPHPRLVPP